MKNQKRQMEINEKNNQTPEQELAQVEKWVKDDVGKLAALIWMVQQEPEILLFIAKKFQAKMNSDVNKQVAEALDKQKDQIKQP